MSVTATLASERGSEYAGLSRQIRAARLLDRTPGHYALRIATTLACFAGCWLALLFVGNSWWALVPAVVLGLVSTQVAFLGHDGRAPADRRVQGG
jgi:fatty acid desaturase